MRTPTDSPTSSTARPLSCSSLTWRPLSGATFPTRRGRRPLTSAERPSMSAIPLSVLDLVPISSGSDASQALRNTIDLAQHAERAGYRRYWFAEHHLNPGVAGTSPDVVIALGAGAADRIRLGSAGVQLAHRTALSTVEEFGLIDALHPGRLDLGLGRSGPQLLKERAQR